MALAQHPEARGEEVAWPDTVYDARRGRHLSGIGSVGALKMMYEEAQRTGVDPWEMWQALNRWDDDYTDRLFSPKFQRIRWEAFTEEDAQVAMDGLAADFATAGRPLGFNADGLIAYMEAAS